MQSLKWQLWLNYFVLMTRCPYGHGLRGGALYLGRCPKVDQPRWKTPRLVLWARPFLMVCNGSYWIQLVNWTRIRSSTLSMTITLPCIKSCLILVRFVFTLNCSCSGFCECRYRCWSRVSTTRLRRSFNVLVIAASQTSSRYDELVHALCHVWDCPVLLFIHNMHFYLLKVKNSVQWQLHIPWMSRTARQFNCAYQCPLKDKTN